MCAKKKWDCSRRKLCITVCWHTCIDACCELLDLRMGQAAGTVPIFLVVCATPAKNRDSHRRGSEVRTTSMIFVRAGGSPGFCLVFALCFGLRARPALVLLLLLWRSTVAGILILCKESAFLRNEEYPWLGPTIRGIVLCGPRS